MKRRTGDWKWAGFAMVTVGIAIMAWCNIQDPDLVGMGRVLVIVGALVAVFAKLNARGARAAEDYREGYDNGMDAGYELAQKEKRERPKLIDMAERTARIERERMGPSARRAGRRADDE